MNTTPMNLLDRLEAFLQQDPCNQALLAQAFEEALRQARHERAQHHLAAGLASGQETLAWRLREAHWHLAGRDWAAAREILERLRHDPLAPVELQRAAAQDEAYAALQQGRVEEGIELLEPLMAPLADTSTGAGPATIDTAPQAQVVWLRLLHRAGQLDRLLAWATDRAAAGRLAADARGVASLGALDAGDLSLAETWSDASLKSHPMQLEALVARATVALGAGEQGQAEALLARATRAGVDDGRVLSTVGLAHLHGGALSEARESLERSVQLMPQHIGTWHVLAWTAFLQQDMARARAVFTLARDMDRNFAESHGGLAVVDAAEGKLDAARDGIQRAFGLDRHCMSARYAQAMLDGEAGDVAALQQLAQRLIAAKARSR